jgi:hypothetical protein
MRLFSSVGQGVPPPAVGDISAVSLFGQASDHYMLPSRLTNVGTSIGLIIPVAICRALNLRAKQPVTIDIRDGVFEGHR